MTWEKAASAGAMGAAISAMHYIAMSGTTLFAAPARSFFVHTVGTSPLGTAAIVATTIVALVFILLSGATVERIKFASEVGAANEALKLEISERRRVQEELGRLSGELLRAQDEERRRIARDLHDSTAQRLATLRQS